MTFLDIGIIDIIDILLVAILLYQVYMLIKGTSAIKIFMGIAALYFVWLVVKGLNMKLLSTILGQVMGVGVIALLIVFQQEVRKFFMLIGNRYIARFDFSSGGMFSFILKNEPEPDIETIVKASYSMAESKTGALIVISDNSTLSNYAETGVILNSKITDELIESIFFKDSPLHDGALIIVKDRIVAAKSILPVSENRSLPAHFGLRHRSAMGIVEQTDVHVVVVSEETGHVSLFTFKEFTENISQKKLTEQLTKRFIKQK